MTRPLAVALWTSAALIPGGFYFALHGMYAELIIITAAALGFIAAALIPAPATESKELAYELEDLRQH